jgi:zinc transporter 2
VNVRAAFIHVLGDCLQSLGVIAAAVIIWVGNVVEFHEVKVQKSWWNMADPVASLLFGVITIVTTSRIQSDQISNNVPVKLTKNIVDVLMERVPAGVQYAEILRELREIPNVSGVHDLHIWAISVGKVSLSCHLQSDDHVGQVVFHWLINSAI